MKRARVYCSVNRLIRERLRLFDGQFIVEKILRSRKRIGKKGLKEYYNYVSSIRTDCDKYATGKRSQKRVRRKKVYTASEQTKNLNYNVTDTDYHLTSVNPEMIVGAMQLWTFNTKTKEITQFVAEDRMGLAVKGTTIQKFNKLSSMKKIGNKTEHFLDRIQEGGKIVLSKGSFK